MLALVNHPVHVGSPQPFALFRDQLPVPCDYAHWQANPPRNDAAVAVTAVTELPGDL